MQILIIILGLFTSITNVNKDSDKYLISRKQNKIYMKTSSSNDSFTYKIWSRVGNDSISIEEFTRAKNDYTTFYDSLKREGFKHKAIEINQTANFDQLLEIKEIQQINDSLYSINIKIELKNKTKSKQIEIRRIKTRFSDITQIKSMIKIEIIEISPSGIFIAIVDYSKVDYDYSKLDLNKKDGVFYRFHTTFF
jgi:hypothetical protein